MNDYPFKAGGSLTVKHQKVYIERKVDRLVADYLRKQEYILIIEPRQQGKSSLVNALMRQPGLQDFLFILIDVTILDISNEAAWYQSLTKRIALQTSSFPKNTLPQTPTNSNGWRDYLSELALLCKKFQKPIIFALDEIGAVDFPGATKFFSVLRDVYNSRQAEPALEYLIFVLVGAFHPRDLITDDKVSPFNIAQRVRIPDFTLDEVEELVSRGEWSHEVGVTLAERIYSWTSGQPYLCQLLCSFLSPEAKPENVDAGVEMIRKLDENHLPNILDQFEKNLDLRNYVTRIMQGEKIKFFPREILRQAQLELLGIIKEDANGYCSIRNEIYRAAIQSVLLEYGSTSSNGLDQKNDSDSKKPSRFASKKWVSLNYETRIGLKTKRGYPVNLTSELGSDANGNCGLQPKSKTFLELIKKIEDGVTDENDLTKLGKTLFENLFSNQLAGHVQSALSAARAKEAGLRILIQFQDPLLASLPWEFLYDPIEESFLAISSETLIVRYIPVSSPANKLMTQLPLRVLIVVSQATELPDLNQAQEVASITEALQELQDQKLVSLQILDHAIPGDILQAMRVFKPHIFHFIGHGDFSGEKAVLVLENENGEALEMTESAFREFFTGIFETRLVLLNSCKSGRSHSAQALTGLAPRILQRKIPAVVAMQFDIPDRSACIFAQEFYRCLALGYPVDAAISEGRKGLFLQVGADHRDWATPVLFLHTKESILFQFE